MRWNKKKLQSISRFLTKRSDNRGRRLNGVYEGFRFRRVNLKVSFDAGICIESDSGVRSSVTARSSLWLPFSSSLSVCSSCMSDISRIAESVPRQEISSLVFEGERQREESVRSLRDVALSCRLLRYASMLFSLSPFVLYYPTKLSPNLNEIPVVRSSKRPDTLPHDFSPSFPLSFAFSLPSSFPFSLFPGPFHFHSHFSSPVSRSLFRLSFA